MITDADAKEIIDYIRQSMFEADQMVELVDELDIQAQQYGYLKQTLQSVAWLLTVKAKVPQ